MLNAAAALGKRGFRVTVLDVDGDGVVDPAAVEKAISQDTILVSIQHANQEIGTVQDIQTIAGICREKGVLFHTDATHTFARLPLDVSALPVDLVTVSAHTLHGPKGVGGFYVRTGTPLAKWMDGGFQEFNRRAGVEDIPSAVGFAAAVDLITEDENERLRALRDRLLDRTLAEIPHTTLNGHRRLRAARDPDGMQQVARGESRDHGHRW